MARNDYKAKVTHNYPRALCVKGMDNRFYIKDMQCIEDCEIVSTTATDAWKQAFWAMPEPKRNVFVNY